MKELSSALHIWLVPLCTDHYAAIMYLGILELCFSWSLQDSHHFPLTWYVHVAEHYDLELWSMYGLSMGLGLFVQYW